MTRDNLYKQNIQLGDHKQLKFGHKVLLSEFYEAQLKYNVSLNASAASLPPELETIFMQHYFQVEKRTFSLRFGCHNFLKTLKPSLRRSIRELNFLNNYIITPAHAQ